MRDMRRIQERPSMNLERPYAVWLTLGSLVLICLVFACGFVMGARYERLDLQLQQETHSIARLSKESKRHRELTFYSELAQKNREKAIREAAVTGEIARTKEQALQQIKDTIDVAPAARERVTETVVAETPVHREPAPTGIEAREKSAPGLEEGPARSGEYTIQVSSYQSLEEARAYSSVLTRKGYRPFVVAAEIAGKGTWYRVRIGRFSLEDAAVYAKQQLARADIPAWVLKME